MEGLKSVFFHELGHFVAHEINLRYYSGTGTQSINIHPSALDMDLFVGEANINLSADERERRAPPLSILPEYLASSTYGCIFQAYYQKDKLSKWLSMNGGDDMNKWYGSLQANGLSYCNAELTDIEEKYFSLLMEKRALDEIMVLDPNHYLLDQGNQNYTIDVQKLKKDTDAFIDSHKEFYDTLIFDYKKILLQD